MSRKVPYFGPALPLIVATVTSACSWWRFDDVTTDPPVRLLEAPANVNGMGTSLATFRDANNATLVFATGLDGYAVFDLSHSGNDAIEQETCRRSDSCFIAERAATIYTQVDGIERPCVAYAAAAGNGDSVRFRLHCDGQIVTSLAVPEAALTLLGTPKESKALGLTFASSPRRTPQRLLASVTATPALVYYPSTSGSGVSVPIPAGATEGFGRAAALLGSRFDAEAPGATLVIGEPTAAKVHLYAVDEAGLVVATACLVGSSDFGSLLATGYFASASSEGIAIGTLSQVTVVPDVTQIRALASASTDCIDITQLNLAKSLDCHGLGLGTSCSSAMDTGSMSAADIDGDTLDELLIGAPTVTNAGMRYAGVVVSLKWGTELGVYDQFSPSVRESGDRLGQAALGVPLSDRDVVLAGAPGGNKLAAFYCSALLPAGKGGKRCQ